MMPDLNVVVRLRSRGADVKVKAIHEKHIDLEMTDGMGTSRRSLAAGDSLRVWSNITLTGNPWEIAWKSFCAAISFGVIVLTINVDKSETIIDLGDH